MEKALKAVFVSRKPAEELPGDYLDTMSALWRLTRRVNENIEPVLLTAEDDTSGFLSTVQKTGIAV